MMDEKMSKENNGTAPRNTNENITTVISSSIPNDPFLYMNGLMNECHTEIIPSTIPLHRNNPKQVPYGLYTEQLSGTSFTISPRYHNRRTWLYRIQPSVAGRTYDNDREHRPNYPYFGKCHPNDCVLTIEPIRWVAPPSSLIMDETKEGNDDNHGERNFIDGMILMCTGGDMDHMKHGINIYMYTNVTKSMEASHHMCNTDGDFLIVPQTGTLIIHTELGRIQVSPTEIAVIPKGIIFQILLVTNDDHDHSGGIAQGYVLEISTGSGIGFQLPELGPIGASGLANGRDFQIPTAWCAATNPEEYHQCQHVVYHKMLQQLVPCYMDHTPYNVIGWYGNYVPYKYNLHYFCTINSVSYDHLDPSIYTVLTCPSHITTGTALADFVLFGPRIMATDANTLRPPWFHKNTMSEFMGLIYGEYDAKVSGHKKMMKTNNDNSGTNDDNTATTITTTTKSNGFVPGGASLHNCMTPHGPDAISYYKAVQDPCTAPKKLENGMAFMFETYLTLRVSPIALYHVEWRDYEYNQCWQKPNQQQMQYDDTSSTFGNDGLSANCFHGWNLLANAMKKENTVSK